MHTVELPRLFYEDHADRVSDRTGPAVSETVVVRKHRTVVIHACDEALAEIESDADYYASMKAGVDMDSDCASVIRSAKTTLQRIREYRAALPRNDHPS